MRRNPGAGRGKGPFPRSLIVEKEEGLVLPNGAANGSAKVVQPQGRSGVAVQVAEPVVRVQFVIAQELVQSAVKLVRARSGYDVDQGRAGEAEFRAEIRLLYFKFLHGIHGRNIRGRQNSTVLLKIRARHTIQQDVGGRIPAAV